MKMRKLTGSSAITLFLLSVLVLLLIGFFLTHAAHYLRASNEAAAQAQISKIQQLIQADRLETQDFYLLHSLDDIYKPYEGDVKYNIKPSQKTLATIFRENDFIPSDPGNNICYLYLYWPREIAEKELGKSESLYLLATWGVQSESLISAGNYDFQKWGRANLGADDFYCKVDRLNPAKKAVTDNGKRLDWPGYDFQFVGTAYSRSY